LFVGGRIHPLLALPEGFHRIATTASGNRHPKEKLEQCRHARRIVSLKKPFRPRTRPRFIAIPVRGCYRFFPGEMPRLPVRFLNRHLVRTGSFCLTRRLSKSSSLSRTISYHRRRVHSFASGRSLISYRAICFSASTSRRRWRRATEISRATGAR
jgi:hypothetical protein